MSEEMDNTNKFEDDLFDEPPRVKVTSAEIIVTGDPKNPYYEIKYLEVSRDEYTVGYGSYNLELVTNWYNNCFEFVEEEKAALERQIKNQKEYDEIRKACDDMGNCIKAIQDSGFSRKEAMQIFMIANISGLIPIS